MTDDPMTKSQPETGNRNGPPAGENRANASASAAARARIANQAAITGRDTATRMMAAFTPPDIWSEQRPCLRELWLYARHGTQAGTHGSARGWARAWAVLVTLPLALTAYYLAWLAERPARFVAALLLYTVLAHTGIGGWLPWPSWLP